MPKRDGHDYYALYFNNKGKKSKRSKGKYNQPTSSEILEFLEDSIKSFKDKYGKPVKLIILSQEMKNVIDERIRGKSFLKNIKLIVSKQDLGLRTVYMSELKEEI